MYKLPELGYSYDALEPHIDQLTMQIHHTKHHQAYVDGLNAIVSTDPKIQNKPLTQLLKEFNLLPENVKNAVRNHGGGHHNHSLFWKVMKLNPSQPSQYMQEMINKSFGTYDEFRKKFEEAAKSRFGSGWAWLVIDQNNNLVVMSTGNQDSPLMQGYKPILGLDVWEHAYYLKYQNRRIDYINEFFKIIDWENVEKFAKDQITLECDLVY